MRCLAALASPSLHVLLLVAEVLAKYRTHAVYSYAQLSQCKTISTAN